MTEDSEQIDQDEIEALLNQSQTPSDSSAEGDVPAASSDAGKPIPPDIQVKLDQGEIEELMQMAGSSSSPETPTSSIPDAASPPIRPPASPSPAASVGDVIAQSDIDYLLNQAEAALASIDADAAELPEGLQSFKLEEFSGTPASSEVATLDLMRDVQLDVRIELGRTHMQLEEVLKLNKGAVVPLDKLAGDPVDIYVNGRLIARGEVLVLNDNFCVRVAELIVGESACA